MGCNRYQIIMKTLMGKKYGLLILDNNKGNLSGFINILGNSNEICGEMRMDGSCRFTGEIITPMRCMKFWAEGYIEKNKVDILIHSDSYLFSVTGQQEII